MKGKEYKTTIILDQKMKKQLNDTFLYSHHHTKSDLIRHAIFIGLQQIQSDEDSMPNIDKRHKTYQATKTTEEKT